MDEDLNVDLQITTPEFVAARLPKFDGTAHFRATHPDLPTIDPSLLHRPAEDHPMNEASSKIPHLEDELSKHTSDFSSITSSDRNRMPYTNGSDSSSDQTPRKYYHLRPGHGGVVKLPMKWRNFDGSEEEVSAISIEGVRTCVGMWIPLTKDGLSFAAHITAWEDDRAQEDEESDVLDDKGKWVPQDPDYADGPKHGLRKKLSLICRDIVKDGTNGTLRGLSMMVCSRPFIEKKKASGFHAIPLLCETFDLNTDRSCTDMASSSTGVNPKLIPVELY